MESWRKDILAALKAGAEGLESAQSEIAKAYREGHHPHRTDRRRRERNPQPGSDGSPDNPGASRSLRQDPTAAEWEGRWDLVLVLLYILTTLELLKQAREAIASGLESAWEQAASAPFQPEEDDKRR